MLNSSGPLSRAARRHGVRGQELRFDLRDDSRIAPQNPAQPARPDVADLDSPPGAASRADRIFTAVISAFMEGFALYAMLYLPATYHEQSSSAETEAGQQERLSVRERRRSIAIVSSSVDPEAEQSKPDNGTHRIELESVARSEHAGLAESHRSPSIDADRSSRRHWLIRPWSGMASRWRRWRDEREIAALVADLEELDDRTLRDIGIPHRSQIVQAVRYGRDC
jgi:uncharacterized protein YjiS (DUF1127 family)